MNPRTQRIALSLALAVVTTACAGTPVPPTGAPERSGAPMATSSPDARLPRPTPTSPSSPTPGETQAIRDVTRLQAAVVANPADADAQRDLGFALLQRIRETADPSLYAPALAAFDAARSLAPDDALVLAGIGGIELGKHDFADALVTGRRAVTLSPNLAAARAVVVDALVELGRYHDADVAVSELLAVGTDLSTLSRVSYIAELHGKLDVALEAMRMAVDLPGLANENRSFALTLLGNLLVATGDPVAASAAYDRALALVPAHAPSLAGKARLAVGEGRLDAAIELFQHAADVLPLPEYVIALADTQLAAGHAADAERSIKLARTEIELFRASGVTVDLDLALFEADHGDPARALGFARTAYKATPTIRAADAIAWALHRLGRDRQARASSDEALRLGSRDALLRYHAGAIAAALGDAGTARADLEMTLATDPGFSATGAGDAGRLLAELSD